MLQILHGDILKLVDDQLGENGNCFDRIYLRSLCKYIHDSMEGQPCLPRFVHRLHGIMKQVRSECTMVVHIIDGGKIYSGIKHDYTITLTMKAEGKIIMRGQGKGLTLHMISKQFGTGCFGVYDGILRSYDSLDQFQNDGDVMRVCGKMQKLVNEGNHMDIYAIGVPEALIGAKFQGNTQWYNFDTVDACMFHIEMSRKMHRVVRLRDK